MIVQLAILPAWLAVAQIISELAALMNLQVTLYYETIADLVSHMHELCMSSCTTTAASS